MPSRIKGQPTSLEVRQMLAELGKPVILCYSRGKDSLAAWKALLDAGCEVVPVHFELCPGMPLVDESVAYVECVFGAKVLRLPHPSLLRMLDANVFQPPGRIQRITDARIPLPDMEQMLDRVREELGLNGCFAADGVRASDSIERRAAMVRHGIVREDRLKASVIADWTKAEVLESLQQDGIELPDDYRLFGRSFDGIDARFTRPLRDYRPADYEAVLRWFPLAYLDILRSGG